MSLFKTQSGARLRSVFAAFLLVSAFLPAESRAQRFFVSPPAGSGQLVLTPVRQGLLPVHTPDLERLEPEVREQMVSLQESFASTARTSGISDEKLAESYGFIGQVYHAYALTVPAEECYLNARRLSPDDYRWAHLLGNVYEATSRPSEAIESYKLVRRLNSNYVAAAVRLGELFLQQNLLEDARFNFAAALKIDDKCSAARYGLGQVALASRQYAEAVTYLEQAAAEVPDANRIHYALAMAYRGLGDIEKARSHLEKRGAVGIRVSDPLIDGLRDLVHGERIHLVRARLAFEARRFQEAAALYRKAVASNPNNVSARLNLGSCLGQLGDDKAAAEQFEQVLKLEPKNSAAHYNLGILLARQNKPEAAIASLRAALDLNASDNQARLLLARQLVTVGRLDDAAGEFTRVIDVDPGNEDALLEKVDVLMKKNDYREAVRTLERGLSSFPQNGRTMIMLAYLLAASPAYDVRDGARSLDLAERVYKTTALTNHGAVVAMALAELGRCGDAAEIQRGLIAGAERNGQTDLAAKLKIELKRYERGNPCRPGADDGVQPILKKN